MKRCRDRNSLISLMSDDGPEFPPRSSVTISSSEDGDLEDTLVDDENIDDVKGPCPKSSSSSDKGKAKEVVEPALDLQEELECFICGMSIARSRGLFQRC